MGVIIQAFVVRLGLPANGFRTLGVSLYGPVCCKGVRATLQGFIAGRGLIRVSIRPHKGFYAG